MFKKTQKGQDGYKYIGGVKYKIKKETANAFYLVGNRKSKARGRKKQSKGARCVNMLLKASFDTDDYIVGDIVSDA